MSTCRHESTIAAALSNGELPEDLHLHLESCAACAEVISTARHLHQLAEGLAREPVPGAASMWWRLNLRMRQQKAQRAQVPLIWMARILYLAIALLTVLVLTLIPNTSRPVFTIGLAALGAVAIPAAIALWTWSRSRT